MHRECFHERLHCGQIRQSSDANNFAADWGPSLNDRTHVISGEVTVFPLDRLSFSAVDNVRATAAATNVLTMVTKHRAG